VVSNSGPLIHLSWIDQLELLRHLHEELLVPVAVRDEVLRAGDDVLGIAGLRAAFNVGWISVQPVANQVLVANFASIVDRGEAEAIALMEEADADLLLLDDLAARKLAQARGLAITGMIGLLREAREHGLIPEVTPLLLELRHTGFRISNALVDRIRQEEGQSS
jgi:predicted nucleic acid-binding protein